MLLMLAVNTQPHSDTSLFIWGGVLMFIAIIGLSAVLAIKRYYSRPDQSTPKMGFTLKDLEQMRLEGKLSDQEYDRAKARMIASVRAPRETPPESPRSG